MPAQQSSSASTHLRPRQVGVRSGLALIAGALAVGLIACGGGTSTPSASPSSAPPTSSRPAAPAAPPGAFGTAAAVNPTSLEVQNPSTGQVTVNFSSSTTFSNTVSGTLADVTVGSCVTATSTAAAGSSAPAAGSPITARAVTITTPGANGCTAGGFGGGAGGFGGRGGAGGAGGTSRPNRPSGSARPSGANGAGRGNFAGRIAFGSVTAVTSTGFTVHSVARGSNPATDTTVTVTSSTTYSKVESADSSALAVGDCIAAVGATDDTGAVTAKTISISKPGPNGCSTGFGSGRGGFGGGGTGGGGNGGSNG
ncbi:MAG TPA: DUF5666 domain-containing protein [Pseudonocardiaceae bacterium]|jgi:hypothetical protein|nr:DUF5666 domain-containing protein [Pseudonocardiaceae bacterium]